MPVKAGASGVIDHPVGKVFHFHAVEHVQNHPRWAYQCSHAVLAATVDNDVFFQGSILSENR